MPPWTFLADIAFLHGYFIGLNDDGSPDGGVFFLSALNDALTWDPLDFSGVNSTTNKLRAITTSHDHLFVIGSTLTQPFYDSGNADFPLVPNQSGTMEVGTIARDSVCEMGLSSKSDDNVIFFLSETPNGHMQMIKIVGFNPTVISTPPLDYIWQEAGAYDIGKVVTWTFQENGHSYVQVCWPQDSPFPVGTQRYDSTTDRWADITWTNPATGLQEAHRGINHAFNIVRHLVGDRATGILWKMTHQLHTDGDPLNPEAKVPMVALREVLLPSDGTKTMFINSIELLAETGVGDGSGNAPADDPQVMLEMSGDGGHTYDPNPESISLGKQGVYETRVVWTGVGSYRQPACRISCSAGVKLWWSGLMVDMQEGVS
jgi:hypothetical protein